MSTTHITQKLLEGAASCGDVDFALARLQDVAVIRDGGIAGQHFDQEKWDAMTPAERIPALKCWLHDEQMHELSEEHDSRQRASATRVLDFDQFTATRRKVEDISTEQDGWDPEFYKGVPAFIYEGGCAIVCTSGMEGMKAFYLLLETQEWTSDDLAELERVLYLEWALPTGCCDTKEPVGKTILGIDFRPMQPDEIAAVTYANPGCLFAEVGDAALIYNPNQKMLHETYTGGESSRTWELIRGAV
jgi:hypothetical protein